MTLKQVSYWEGRMILKKNGIEVSEGELVGSEVEAVKAARRIGYPVVMKLVGTDLLHKSDVGGVITHINCDEELILSFRKLMDVAKKHEIRADGVAVEKMERGLELIVGVKTDVVFGKVIMVGLGGVFTEVIKDIAVRVLPVTRKDVMNMLHELKYGFLLDGFRNYPKVNRRKVVDVVMKVARMVEKEKVYEMDINPLFVWKDRAVAADVRIILER